MTTAMNCARCGTDLADHVNADVHFVAVCSSGTNENGPDECGCSHFFGPEKPALKEIAQPDIDDDHPNGNAKEKTADDKVEIF